MANNSLKVEGQPSFEVISATGNILDCSAVYKDGHKALYLDYMTGLYVSPDTGITYNEISVRYVELFRCSLMWDGQCFCLDSQALDRSQAAARGAKCNL